jgi:hypothetical protein
MYAMRGIAGLFDGLIHENDVVYYMNQMYTTGLLEK